MKRSEINQIIEEGIQFFDEQNYKLPPFAFWTMEDWQQKGPEYDEIKDNQMGWDITDVGSGDYEKEGLFLFTVRNGNLEDERYDKDYAEKIMIVKENQVTPHHFHWNKMEDIINRGGGNLMIQLYNATADEALADTPVTVYSDGRTYQVPAGTTVRLTPGESITLKPYQYHSFWGEDGQGQVLVGEVSKTNDDATDNRFLKTVGRFPEIEENEPVKYLLVGDYKKFLK
ncbi:MULTISPECIES: D-lyxose/D-mannose family sugar isomerase [Enterococcus]|uniref:D-lyxose/D-mannose family sugar isomerase n=1 Tax=Enterococcus alishanensis TaxID=1303817 RepID=A0ABS6TA17_9ENTE|nr:D-lyxose/D-mannose family sugar isomerase [Enterococcus alishanensis]MBV7389752.1 D-lyxose/D-mannose family sugar isomerase [Enterococcus alishanensis]